MADADPYDLAVIGAGIQGAGVAQAAAAAGHRVLVLERTAPAAGTSSRSTKLIHGGLRYLETGQIRLVREALREQALLLANAPNLVHRLRLTIPVYGRGTLRPGTLYAGLLLYRLLGNKAGFRRIDPRRWDNPDGLDTRTCSRCSSFTRPRPTTQPSPGPCFGRPWTWGRNWSARRR